MKTTHELVLLLKSGEYDGGDLMQAWCRLEQLQQERDQIVARCELLRKFGAGWAERAGADDQAWDYLSDLSSGVYSLAHHDAELLRSACDQVEQMVSGRVITGLFRDIADQLEREQ